MTHDEALIDRLVAFAAGELEGASESAVRRHLEACAECRDWLASYRGLAEALREGREARRAHLGSEAMARLAVGGRAARGLEIVALREHLEDCKSCSRELKLAEAALAAAGDRPRTRHRQGGERSADRRWLRPAVAAGLAVAIVGAGALLTLFGAHRSTDVMVNAPSGAGDRTIEAERLLVAENTTLAAGSRVRMRAGEMVVFGEGFAVRSDAILSVEITGASRAQGQRAGGTDSRRD